MVAIPDANKSTTGRSQAGPVAPAALGAGLRALFGAAPALAERLALRLFSTPPRHPPPPREAAALVAAEPFALAAGGTTLRGHRLGEGPAVLLVHGWGGRGGQLAALAPPLLAGGCSVVVFDGPAHGASGGRTTDLGRHVAGLAAVARHFGARAALAHSFGAAALVLAMERGLALDAAVLVGPPRSPRQFLEAFCAAFGLGPGARARVARRLERRVGVALDALDGPQLVRAFATPALIVHDRDDGEVPFEDGVALADAWPGARLLATEGLGHRRVLRDGAVAAAVAAFVLAALPRCACGRLAAAHAHGAPRCETCALALYLERREERGELAEAVSEIVRAADRLSERAGAHAPTWG